MILRWGGKRSRRKIAEMPAPYNLEGQALRLLEGSSLPPDRKWLSLLGMCCDFMPYRCQDNTFLLKAKHLWAPILVTFGCADWCLKCEEQAGLCSNKASPRLCTTTTKPRTWKLKRLLFRKTSFPWD